MHAVARTVVAVLALAGPVPAAPAFAGSAAEPRGPAFGNNAYEAEIRDDGGPDADDFVGTLLAGERLSVSVTPLRGSPLLPGIALIDPAGVARTPPLRSGGAAVSLRSFTADLSGRWTVRVEGAGGSEGRYAVRFRVRSRRTAIRRTLAPGPAAPAAEVPFPGAAGARLDLRLDGAGPGAPGLAVLDPAGSPHPLVPPLLWRRGSAWVLEDLPLDRGDGTWRVAAAAGEGARRLSLRVAVADRPRGRTVLGTVEPRLEERAVPLEGIPGSTLRLAGSGFPRRGAPAVWIGGLRAVVLEGSGAGDRLDVVVPDLPPGEEVEVAVVNPDGQACAAPGYLRIRPPGPPGVREFLPAEVRVAAGGTVEVRLLLAGHAPPGGMDIPLEVEGGVGEAPAFVRAAPFALEAAFPFTAGPAGGRGLLRALSGGGVVVPVTVADPPPPASLDLAGWRLRQTSASKTWVLPEGTVVPRGGALVVARKADRAAFEAFWGTTLEAGVAFLDSGDRFPSLNGDETLSLEDPDGVVVDGPTVALAVGRSYRRVPGTPPGLPGSWIEEAAVPGTVVPGGPPPPAPGPAGLHIARFADPSATGQFVFEFLEIRWDGEGP